MSEVKYKRPENNDDFNKLELGNIHNFISIAIFELLDRVKALEDKEKL